MNTRRLTGVALSMVVFAVGCERSHNFDYDGDGVVDEDDCSPGDPAIFPGAEEICTDGVDNDCDQLIDGDDGDCQHDSDGDGYSTPEDCHDGDATIHPGMDEEICDGVDNDCDSLTPDEPDADADGASVCVDCDDFDAGASPDHSEILCDGVDNDCDAITEDEPDNDGDGYTVCEDCDDSEALVNEGMDEICGDGLDNDCDGTLNDCRLEGDIPLSMADVKLVGEDSDEYAGESVASVGDMDGDGMDEILVGAPYAMYRGAVYVIDDPQGPELDLSMYTARLLAERLSSEAGRSVSGAGDVNGDSIPDIVIGAPNYMDDRGAAYVVEGPLSGEIDLENATARLLGPAGADEECGYVVAGGGDATGDGLDDVLVGAPGADGYTGRVYLAPGPLAGEYLLDTDPDILQIDAEHFGVGMGESAAFVGDIDLDGADDFMVSALYEYVGTAYLFYGPVVGDIDLGSAAVEFGNGGDLTGLSLGGAGDVNGDSYPDIMVGALPLPGNGVHGGLYLVDGPMTGDVDLVSQADANARGEELNDGAASALAAPGDLDGDGHDEVLVGAPFAGELEETGSAYLLYGPVTGIVELSAAAATFTGEAEFDNAGFSLASGDFNGDTIPDLLIGAPNHDAGGHDAGAAYVIYGRGGL